MKLLLDFFKIFFIVVIWELISFFIEEDAVLEWNIFKFLLKVSIIFFLFLTLKYLSKKKDAN